MAEDPRVCPTEDKWRVLVLAKKYALSWPQVEGEEAPDPAQSVGLTQALAQDYRTDAHFAAYVYPTDQTERHAYRLRTDSGVIGVRLIYLVFDVDAPKDARDSAGHATDQWWNEQRQKIDSLPGEPLVYRTRGGYRIVYRLWPFRYTEGWTEFYLRAREYLKSYCRIEADTKCKDWTRLFRLPHATRFILEPERLETVREVPGVWPVADSDLPSVEVPATPEPVEWQGPVPERPTDVVDRARAWLATCPAAIAGEGGHDRTFSVACTLVRGFLLTESEARDLLGRDYSPRCEPPWSSRELEHKVRSALRAAGECGYMIGPRRPRCPTEDTPEGIAVEEVQSAAAPLLIETDPEPSPDPDDVEQLPSVQAVMGTTPQPQQRTVLQRGSETELANLLIDRLGGFDNLMFDEGSVWHYNEKLGVWTSLDTATLTVAIMRFDGAHVIGEKKGLRIGKRLADGVIALLSRALEHRTMVEHRSFARARHGVTFRNGFVTVEEGAIHIEPISPANLSRHRFDWNYDPAAALHGCEKLGRFWLATFKDCTPEERVARLHLIEEFQGACLTGMATKLNKCLILTGAEDGGGGEGKSEALKILKAPFPPGSVTSIKPQLWSQRFTLAGLRGMLANFVDEMPPKVIGDDEAFKSVIAGAVQHAEKKGKDGFDYSPIAGHIWCANSLPATGDQSNGFWRRNMICVFSRDMDNAPEKDPDAARKVIEAELPGIVARALEGAARLQRQGHYTCPPSSAAALERWKLESNPVKLYAEQACVPDAKARTSPDDLFQSFSTWAKGHGFKPLNATTFFRRLGALKIKSKHQKDERWYEFRCPTPIDGGRRVVPTPESIDMSEIDI